MDLRWAPQQQQKEEEGRWEGGGGRVEREAKSRVRERKVYYKTTTNKGKR